MDGALSVGGAWLPFRAPPIQAKSTSIDLRWTLFFKNPSPCAKCQQVSQWKEEEEVEEDQDTREREMTPRPSHSWTSAANLLEGNLGHYPVLPLGESRKLLTLWGRETRRRAPECSGSLVSSSSHFIAWRGCIVRLQILKMFVVKSPLSDVPSCRPRKH